MTPITVAPPPAGWLQVRVAALGLVQEYETPLFWGPEATQGHGPVGRNGCTGSLQRLLRMWPGPIRLKRSRQRWSDRLSPGSQVLGAGSQLVSQLYLLGLPLKYLPAVLSPAPGMGHAPFQMALATSEPPPLLARRPHLSATQMSLWGTSAPGPCPWTGQLPAAAWAN